MGPGLLRGRLGLQIGLAQQLMFSRFRMIGGAAICGAMIAPAFARGTRRGLRRGKRLAVSTAVLLLAVPAVARAQPAAARPQAVFDRAVAEFLAGRIEQSVAGFDQLAKLAPGSAADLWQRGIALYYAGRYRDCRAQFEAHRIVNPNDVENAAWHFLCVARGDSVQAAKAALLPVGPDARLPMRQIYDLFRGAVSPDEVLRAAGARPEAIFYAHLYLGLYFEALGDKARALEHITTAAAERYRAQGGYMHAVARIHLSILQRRQ
jgi:lipoprotein NlpI